MYIVLEVDLNLDRISRSTLDWCRSVLLIPLGLMNANIYCTRSDLVGEELLSKS